MKELKIIKIKPELCPLCRQTKNVKFLGVDIVTRKKVFQCNFKNHFNGKKYTFCNKETYKTPSKLIKCPKCAERDSIRFNGYEKKGFICKNRKAHKDIRNVNFTVPIMFGQMNLRKYIIDYHGNSLYKELHEVYTKSKTIKISLNNHKDLIQRCLNIGLNQDIIAAIFAVNQSTISRFINNQNLTIYRRNKYLKIPPVEGKVFYIKLKVSSSLEIPYLD